MHLLNGYNLKLKPVPMKHLLSLLLLLVCLCITSHPVVAHPPTTACVCDPVADSLELVNFYQNFDGDNWVDNTNWLMPGMPISTWHGITLNGDGCVSEIQLHQNQLSGSIYDINLPELTALFIRVNQIIGEIPDFSNLPFLTNLDLSTNLLSGEIPDFSNLPELLILSLEKNMLSGEIPDFTSLPTLLRLTLYGNQLSGEIPDFSNFPNMLQLSLSSNQLSGTIPDFSSMPELKTLDLADNNLTGEIPNFTVITDIRTILIMDNELSGPIPDLQAPEMDIFIMNNNKLSGEIPDFSNLPKLQWIWAHDNELSGELPSFSNLPALLGIQLDRNKISGQLPDLTGMPDLYLLSMRDNDLEGAIPDYSNLDTFDIGNNRYTFTDIISTNYIDSLQFAYAPQKPVFQDSLFYLEKDENLDISLGIDPTLNNNIYSWKKDTVAWTPPVGNDPNSNTLLFPATEANNAGRYVASITNPLAPDLTLYSHPISLQVCDIQQDSLELVKLYNATGGDEWTDKTNWLLPGMPISSWHGVTIDGFGCVQGLDLKSNNLTGTLPVLDINTLHALDLEGNQLVGNIPKLETPFIQRLNLSKNDLTGNFPSVRKFWVNLEELNLSHNSLSDHVPPDLGDLCEITELRINNNNFTGELPERLTLLTNLEIGKVDFSNNQIDSLEDKLIWFCPYGDTILSDNPSYDRFLGICDVQCAGDEWDNLNNFPWILDTLENINCNDVACEYSFSQAGFVDVRGVKVIFTRFRCYFALGGELDYTDEVRFYDCGGNILETAICDQLSLCTQFGAISREEFDNLDYDIRWSCGQTPSPPNAVNEHDPHDDPTTWPVVELPCFPNPADILLTCEEAEKISSNSIQVFDLLGRRHTVNFQMQYEQLRLDISQMPPGIYIISAQGKQSMYVAKVLVK